MTIKKPKQIDLQEGQIEALQERVKSGRLSRADRVLIASILDVYVWLQFTLQEAKISLSRLKKFFGFDPKTEKSVNLPQKEAEIPQDTSDHGVLIEEAKKAAFGSEEQTKKDKKKVPGHGRLGHKAYTGAEEIKCSHGTFKAGDPCPEGCGGKLYALLPTAFIALKGNALASATRYVCERLRCALCNKVFTASPGPGIRKYSFSLIAALVISRYYMGTPSYRLAKSQEMLGVPLPATTQWRLSEEYGKDLVPLYDALTTYAAQGYLTHYDDSDMKILSLMKENKQNPDLERTGMFVTSILSTVGNHKISLFITGRQHAGENMRDFLLRRMSDLPPLICMSDALSRNFKLDEFINEVIQALCLQHGRRKFYEIYKFFPEDCHLVLDTFSLVYHYDSIAKEQAMTPSERLVYHQTRSAPLMNSLKTWMHDKLNEKKVEPNSSLGQAIRYMLKNWYGMTQFLHVEGCPLDNSFCEQSLKVIIVCRKNSLFFKTENGAFIGSLFTSLIYTCKLAGENPFHYLVSLQENMPAVLKDPTQWFPSNYKQQLGGLTQEGEMEEVKKAA